MRSLYVWFAGLTVGIRNNYLQPVKLMTLSDYNEEDLRGCAIEMCVALIVDPTPFNLSLRGFEIHTL